MKKRPVLADSGHVEEPRLRAEQRTVGVASKLLLARGSGTQCQRVAQQTPRPLRDPHPCFYPSRLAKSEASRWVYRRSIRGSW